MRSTHTRVVRKPESRLTEGRVSHMKQFCTQDCVHRSKKQNKKHHTSGVDVSSNKARRSSVLPLITVSAHTRTGTHENRHLITAQHSTHLKRRTRSGLIYRQRENKSIFFSSWALIGPTGITLSTGVTTPLSPTSEKKIFSYTHTHIHTYTPCNTNEQIPHRDTRMSNGKKWIET
jgi:hypothetical protein